MVGRGLPFHFPPLDLHRGPVLPIFAVDEHDVDRNEAARFFFGGEKSRAEKSREEKRERREREEKREEKLSFSVKK